MKKHKRETKSKKHKHNDHYGLSLTIDNSRTVEKFQLNAEPEIMRRYKK